jgi:hypothetical protein
MHAEAAAGPRPPSHGDYAYGYAPPQPQPQLQHTGPTHTPSGVPLPPHWNPAPAPPAPPLPPPRYRDDGTADGRRRASVQVSAGSLTAL